MALGFAESQTVDQGFTVLLQKKKEDKKIILHKLN